MNAFLYQYTVGGLVFFVGLLYAWRQGFVGLSGKPLRNLVILLLGFMTLMGLQGYLQFAPMDEAAAVDYEGPPLRRGMIGQPLDYGVMIAYFIAILAVGTFFGRRQSSTKDFFFAGQRFSWWLIALSLVATTVGSYSFVKYGAAAYSYGLSSSQSYLNDWFWMPLFLFGWLPILYFSRLTSIPEYFQRRFGSPARNMVTGFLLVYLIGYVGVNLYTMGIALNAMLGWNVWLAAALVAAISASYVTFGGQTSVIMTDLLQGVMLLATGAILLYLGIDYLDGFENFWENLPRDHRRAFSDFNENSAFPAVGIFWQDAMANSAMFYFLNQGILMRFMAAKSVNEGRKAAFFVPIILMPIAAIAVASGGWVGRALVNAGAMPSEVLDPATGEVTALAARQVFYYTAEFLSQPGVFGLIMAALTAALMSTVDTLVTAVSAIVVNDVYKPRRPQATEKQLLKAARISALSVTIFGLLLVPIFTGFKSVLEAHAAFTAAVTPPMVVALLFAVFWRRYTHKAAVWTLGGGGALIVLSLFVPELVAPFAHGIPLEEGAAITKQYKFSRAFFGLTVSAVIGVVVTLMTRPESEAKQDGLVWGTIRTALTRYKGAPGREISGKNALCSVRLGASDTYQGEARLPVVTITRALADGLGGAEVGSLIYLTDSRSWLGGLRSAHAVVGEVSEGEQPEITIGPATHEDVVASGRTEKQFRVEWLY